MAGSLRVRLSDIQAKRAYIRYDGDAKVKLCHLAGAPWFERDPKAQLHDLQREVLHRREREKIIHGASRLGKSVLGGCEALLELMLPAASTAIVASRYDHVAHEYQYVYKGMRRLFREHWGAFQRIVFKHQSSYHDYDTETIWGSRVRGFSTDSDEGAALLGQEFSRVVLGEGSHISKDILEKKIMRAVDGALMKSSTSGCNPETGYLSIYTTPKGMVGCSASEWERVMKQTRRMPEALHYDRVGFAASVWIREADILENPAYDRKVYEARKKSMDPQAFAEQYQGKMTHATGRVIPEYTEDRHRLPEGSFFPPELIRTLRLGVGIDTGACFGAVLAGIGPDRRKYILGEVYTEKQTIDTSCAELQEMIERVLEPAYGRIAWPALERRIDAWFPDPASQHKMEIMDLLGVTLASTFGVTSRGEVAGKLELLPSLEIVRGWFANDEIMFNSDVDWLSQQIERYVWKIMKAPRSQAMRAPVVKEPKKDFDHVIDAARFVLCPLEVLGPIQLEDIEVVSWDDAVRQHNRDRLFGELKRIKQRAANSPGGRIVC